MVRCAICYHFRNLKNVKNTHGGVLILVKLQANRATHHKREESKQSQALDASKSDSFHTANS